MEGTRVRGCGRVRNMGRRERHTWNGEPLLRTDILPSSSTRPSATTVLPARILPGDVWRGWAGLRNKSEVDLRTDLDLSSVLFLAGVISMITLVPAAMVPSCCSKEALCLSLSSWPLRETTWSCTAKQPLRSAWLGSGLGLGLG